MALFPATALATIEAASTAAMVDTCTFELPPSGGTYDPATRETTGGTDGASYTGACKLHDGLPKAMRASGVAEGSPLHDAEGWLRLPPFGDDGLVGADFAAFRANADRIDGTVTTGRGVTLAFTGVGAQNRVTHARLFIRFTGTASAS